MLQLLGADGVLALPTAPGPAIPIDMPGAQVDDWRTRLLSLTCIAGLAGLPQVWNVLCVSGLGVWPWQCGREGRTRLLSLTCIAGLAGLPQVGGAVIRLPACAALCPLPACM